MPYDRMPPRASRDTSLCNTSILSCPLFNMWLSRFIPGDRRLHRQWLPLSVCHDQSPPKTLGTTDASLKQASRLVSGTCQPLGDLQ